MAEDRKINKLTGKPVSDEMQKVLDRLSSEEYVGIEEIENTPEIQLARTHVLHTVDTIFIKGREAEQERILEELNQQGAAGTVDEHGKMLYNQEVFRDARLDIVIGLPGSGKSSSIVDVISQEFHSRVIDNDEAKKKIIEYNNGWGAGVVHRESKLISELQLKVAQSRHENIVLPKVGSDIHKLREVVHTAKANGYKVNLHYVELSRNKALGRMLNRFIEEGRFLDPKLIDGYCNDTDGNKIERCYEELKKGGELDGYSKWNNDVKRGERPFLIEADCTGEFIQHGRIIENTVRNKRDNGKCEPCGAPGNAGVGQVRFNDHKGMHKTYGGSIPADSTGATHRKSRNTEAADRKSIKQQLEAKKTHVQSRENGSGAKEVIHKKNIDVENNR